MKNLIRIANAGGYWGDDPYALRRQVLGELPLDYISMDFLAEITMSILQKQRARDPAAGYARDFVKQIEPVLGEVLDRGIKVITNAGGVNPEACAEALFGLARELALPLKIAVVSGDDVLPRLGELTLDNMETGEPLGDYRDRVLSANAYFGAMPVVEALQHDPNIVLSGRVTDTGITLAALIHEFGWAADDYDRLAQGIVASHLIECGAQATGGNFTDWEKVDSYVDIGYPIVEFEPDGTFVVTKHPGTGGLVSLQTVREQFLYEMGHPQLYITPDVIADFTTMKLDACGESRVRVTGARGSAPTDWLKVSLAIEDGFKSQGTLMVSGPDARAKAACFAGILWTRARNELEREGLDFFEAHQTEYIGDDSTHRRLTPEHRPTEILLKLAVRDHDRKKLEIFRKLLPGLILSGPAGVAVTGGAPSISDVVRYWPSLIPQAKAPARFEIWSRMENADRAEKLFASGDLKWPETRGTAEATGPVEAPVPAETAAAKTIEIPLALIAHARSGDKGDTANIGLIGRSADCYVWIRDHVTAERVRDW
ncbi:MAG TPA: acyclic terpene utilization AtuA family protein, partial [Vicinamibacteria bacterium]|nr:acyclic terpene utilization AtuA family protein [Vicinamibacteria bacterium]